MVRGTPTRSACHHHSLLRVITDGAYPGRHRVPRNPIGIRAETWKGTQTAGNGSIAAHAARWTERPAALDEGERSGGGLVSG